MVMSVCPCTSIPSSKGVGKVDGPPLQAVRASPCPVMVKPFNSSVTFDAVIAMQGAPVTVQVTSGGKVNLCLA
jgi:hypothetical protein